MDAPFKTIADALNLAELPEDQQEAILLDINDAVFKGALVRLVDRMDEKTQKKFSKLLDSDASGEDVEAFIKAHVPEADEIVADTVKEIQDDILAVTESKTV
jgi:hypothetical protein